MISEQIKMLFLVAQIFHFEFHEFSLNPDSSLMIENAQKNENNGFDLIVAFESTPPITEQVWICDHMV